MRHREQRMPSAPRLEVQMEQGSVENLFGQLGFHGGDHSNQQRSLPCSSLEIDQRGQDVESWAVFDGQVGFQQVLVRHEEVGSKRGTVVLPDDSCSHDLPDRKSVV